MHEYEYRGERMRMVPLPLGHGPTGQRRLDATTSRYVKIRRSAATMELSWITEAATGWTSGQGPNGYGKCKKVSGAFTIDQTDFTGVLKVLDLDLFTEALQKGVGSTGKAFGMGMLCL